MKAVEGGWCLEAFASVAGPGLVKVIVESTSIL